MSNVETSKLYEAIIEEVISDSRQDFEDSGIDESTLQELRKTWCDKLSQASVAKFSWDEELANTYGIGQAASPKLESDHSSNVLGGSNINLDNVSGLELPNIQAESQLSYNTTTDLNNSNTNSEIQFPSIDPTPKQEFDENSTGLMLPRINQADGLVEFTFSSSKGKEFLQKMKNGPKSEHKIIRQADGNDGDDDDDEENELFNDTDDINSDLDEGLESEKSDEEDGDQEGQIMLCLYDKVQRVRNKWKSNLKEGIANINGRDYVFQKSTGESEW